ncbi:MAG: hypothetical protein HWD85_11915 [Flavobacteriaceae bacterium]|nr:hypothetical protein [Flavobacteriaceae bacterium]
MNSKNSFFFWVVLGLFAHLLIGFSDWRFDANDDVLMMWLVSGGYTGDYESYAVFLHPFLSSFLASLYSIVPNISWYPVFWFLFLFFAYVGVIFSIFYKSNTIRIAWVLSFFVLLVWIHFCFFLQFTLVAGAAAFSAYLIFEKALKFKSKILYGISIILIVISILVRWESFALFSIGYGLYLLVCCCKDNFRKIILHLIPIISLFLFFRISDYVFINASGLADFKAYTKARSSVFDHPAFYSLATKDYLAPGSNWFFFSLGMMDGNQTNLESLKSLKNELDKNLFSVNQAFRSFDRIKEIMVFQRFKAVMSLFIVLGYFGLFFWKPKKMLFFGLWILFIVVFNHFFIINPRVFILLFMVLLIPILSYSSQKTSYSRFLIPSFVMLFGIAIIHCRNFMVEANRRDLIEEEFDALINSIDPNQLMVFEGYRQNFLPLKYSKINPVPYISVGWISNSPFQKKALARFGIKEFQEADNYYLFGIDVGDTYYFNDFMRFLGKNYSEIKELNSDNIQFFEFKADSSNQN